MASLSWLARDCSITHQAIKQAEGDCPYRGKRIAVMNVMVIVTLASVSSPPSSVNDASVTKVTMDGMTYELARITARQSSARCSEAKTLRSGPEEGRYRQTVDVLPAGLEAPSAGAPPATQQPAPARRPAATLLLRLLGQNEQRAAAASPRWVCRTVSRCASSLPRCARAASPRAREFREGHHAFSWRAVPALKERSGRQVTKPGGVT